MNALDADVTEIVAEEGGLLGLVIVLPGAVEAAVEECDAQDFVIEIHQNVFELYQAYAEDGKRPTFEEVSEALGDAKRNVAGGLTLAQYLAKLAAEAPVTDGLLNARNLARSIRLRAEVERGERTAPDPEPDIYQPKYGPMYWGQESAAGEPYEWIIKGLAPSGKTLLIAGPSGSGKTFVTFDMAAHVALGRDYRKRRTKKKGVAYCFYESAEGATQRIEAYVRERGLEDQKDVPLLILRRPPQLFASEENPKALAAELNELTKRWAVPLGVLVIDTHNSSTRGSSEIRSEDISRIINIHEGLRANTGAALWIVGHTNDEGRHRGNQQFYNTIDAAIFMEKLEAKDGFVRDDDDRVVRRATVVKMREGKDGYHWDFTLKEIELRKDEDGDPVTSMVVTEPADARAQEAGGRTAADARSTGAFWLRSMVEIQFFKALLEAIRIKGVPASQTQGAGANVAMVARYEDVVDCFSKQEPRSPRESEEVYMRKVIARVREAGKNLKHFGVVALEAVEAPAEEGKTKRAWLLWPTGRRVEGKAYVWPPAPKEVTPKASAAGDVEDETQKGSAF